MSKEAINAALDKKAENARELGLDYEPAHRPWVGLTDADFDVLTRGLVKSWVLEHIVRNIEAKLKEKNT